jgi:hypothetical protein
MVLSNDEPFGTTLLATDDETSLLSDNLASDGNSLHPDNVTRDGTRPNTAAQEIGTSSNTTPTAAWTTMVATLVMLLASLLLHTATFLARVADALQRDETESATRPVGPVERERPTPTTPAPIDAADHCSAKPTSSTTDIRIDNFRLERYYRLTCLYHKLTLSRMLCCVSMGCSHKK